MNCSRCGSELRYGPLYGFCFSTAMSDYRVGLSRPMVVCLHTKTECLQRQLAAVTAERDRLIVLLADALANCPDSYSRPCLDALRTTVDKAANLWKGGAK